MGRVVVITNLTLDGVMQAPGRPEEDTRGGFKHGGWAVPFGAMMQAGEAFANMGGFLFSQRTYKDFYTVWPNRTDNPFTGILNSMQKYVASTTLREPLPSVNSTLLVGDATKTVATLRKEHEKDLIVFGSGVLVRALMRAGLVDEFVLLIHPLILGSGRRLFDGGSELTALTLRQSRSTANGVVVATYGPATEER